MCLLHVLHRTTDLVGVRSRSHLMVTNPEQWVEEFSKIGVEQYTFHIEATSALFIPRSNWASELGWLQRNPRL